MGSFNMTASFSKMPIRWNQDTVVIICLKRKHEGYTELMPITYPIFGKYWDYGEVHDFEENEITKAICDFFDFDNMNDVINFIYDMTIHGDYEQGLERIKEGKEPYEKERFEKYVSILDKLKKNSLVKIETDEEIIERFAKYIPKNVDIVNSVYDHFLKCAEEKRDDNKELIDSYELALFYEHRTVWEALTGPQIKWRGDKEPSCDYEVNDDVSMFGEYKADKNNLFCITKDCTSSETIAIKEGLHRLYYNFRIESKKFGFEETWIEGQDHSPYMWYSYGKAIKEIWEVE